MESGDVCGPANLFYQQRRCKFAAAATSAVQTQYFATVRAPKSVTAAAKFAGESGAGFGAPWRVFLAAREGSRGLACSRPRTRLARLDPAQGQERACASSQWKNYGVWAASGATPRYASGQPSPAAHGDASSAHQQPSFFKETRPLSFDQRTSEAKGSPGEARRQPQPCLKIAR